MTKSHESSTGHIRLKFHLIRNQLQARNEIIIADNSYGPGCIKCNQKMNNDCTKSPFTLVEQITRKFFDWWWAAISGIVCHVNERTSSREWSIWNETEGRMGYWLRGHEGERNNCFSKIQLVGQKYRDKTTLASKTRFSRHCFGFQSHRFSLLVGYNI